EPTKVTAGIAQMVGCWTRATVDGADVYTARFDAQPDYGDGGKEIRGVDLNGFLVGAWNKDQGLQVNTKAKSVRSVELGDGSKAEVAFYSMGWPDPKKPVLMGGAPVALNFTAPDFGEVLIEDFRLGSNAIWSKVLGGFSPIGDVETPAKITEDGKGSMDFTVQLTGIFTLKGRPQSVTIKIPTRLGEGAKIDGFAVHLQEIDGIKLIKITDFEAEYSAEEKKLGGGADFSLPFMGGKGVSFGFEVEDMVLTKANVGVSGIKVPIGAPPAGFVTSLSGGFGFNRVDDAFVLNLNAAATAEFGPEVPTPWGKVVPLEVSSALKIGKEKQDFYFLFDGGVKVFRLPVGSVYLKIHTNSGVAFGFNIGVGFPSYSNNPNDPFYIGAKVDGWVAKQRFQFEGRGKVRLIGLDIFDGRILINSRAAGACWKVTWFDGGAVYEYGHKDVQTFGVGCGLDRYREKYPAAASGGVAVASAGRPRKLTTGPREVILSARGQGDAPRFQLTSPDGRTFEVPRDEDVIRTKRFMIVVDRENKVTHVAAGGLAKGKWTLTPYQGSAPVMGVKTGKALPPEKVEARIVGKGLNRTLIWDSKGNPNTKIAFSELMAGGYEQPILVTDKVRGRYRFKATKGTHYGPRRLRAVVVHNGTPREATIEDRFAVKRPAKLRAPRVVRAWRNVYNATATWKGVPGARGYVAEIMMKKAGKRVSSYRRVVGPRKRTIVIPSHPGGSWAVANVQALNADGVPGRTGTRKFRLSPPNTLSLRQTGMRSADSARRVGGRVKLRTICPVDGHCQTRVLLNLGRRIVDQTSFQQVPDTYRFVRLAPRPAKLRRQLARGKLKRLRVVVHQHRIGKGAAGDKGRMTPARIPSTVPPR
ncbi:MAG: hypothetical protein M3Y45_00505, partial [Actinomycetota bacterium]|nr:hypothetical protein [Actinomycetota bacterium]